MSLSSEDKTERRETCTFFIHCASTLRLVKVGSNVMDAKNECTNRDQIPNKRKMRGMRFLVC